ncbi:glycosyltransferase family 2 protein [Flavobacterium sp. AG291]|uniref:glycosyltransferase family 2 protein n=1 Tax=Flavobacterium sp. AG291 TaxID=2184000 RepID=UPI000E0A1561|nr:glycosyltransferase family 2 protein [Flavobacterium sp. AG291]RDI08285.1 glycosyltransferase involved in cell wall biosynthesis [Flavobacterium sp. AG291]
MNVTLVVPVYNEQLNLNTFIDEFNIHYPKFSELNYNFDIQFVDDGSKDNTAAILEALANKYVYVRAILFSRNFGKESALFAGLEHASGDLIIPMDVDLQDPFEVVFEMLKKYEEGADVVLAKRIDRGTDSYLKRRSAEMFYKVNNKMSSLKLEDNVGDFRLMTRQVVNEILKLKENQLFMKGLMSWVGFDTVVVTYVRPARNEGDTKFNFFKLWNLAIQGITSFSTLPLKIWTYFGGITAFISFLYGLKIIIEKLFFGINVSGYASLMVAVLFFGGVQLIGIGVIGEYLGRTYLETKQRPKYIIKKSINENQRAG